MRQSLSDFCVRPLRLARVVGASYKMDATWIIGSFDWFRGRFVNFFNWEQLGTSRYHLARWRSSISDRPMAFWLSRPHFKTRPRYWSVLQDGRKRNRQDFWLILGFFFQNVFGRERLGTIRQHLVKWIRISDWPMAFWLSRPHYKTRLRY